MKRLFYAAALLSLGLLLTACPGPEPTPAPAPPETAEGKLIASISGPGVTMTFLYDDAKRLTSFVSKEGQEVETITYSYPNSQTIRENTPEYSFVYTLDSRGYPVSTAVLAEDIPGQGTITYTNERWTKYIQTWDDFTATFNCTWNGANLKTISFDAYGDQGVSTFEYGAVANKHNLDLNVLLAGDETYVFGPALTVGKRSANLMSKMTFSEQMGEDIWDESSEFRYDTDEGGYVTRIYVKTDGKEQAYTVTYR